jgi:hypothetical protein
MIAVAVLKQPVGRSRSPHDQRRSTLMRTQAGSSILGQPGPSLRNAQSAYEEVTNSMKALTL